METLLTCRSPEAARHLESRLRMAGIPHTSTFDESARQRYLYFTEPMGAYKVRVADQELEAARQKVHEWESVHDPDLEFVIHCPQCHGSDIDYPQTTRKSFLPNFGVELFMKLGFIEPEFYCMDCHYTWPRDEMLAAIKEAKEKQL